MKLAIVGTGYVGLVTGACFAEFGYETICIDKDETRINSLKLGKCPFYEPGMDELLTKHLSNTKLLKFSSSLEKFDFEIIESSGSEACAIQTPIRELGTCISLVE